MNAILTRNPVGPRSVAATLRALSASAVKQRPSAALRLRGNNLFSAFRLPLSQINLILILILLLLLPPHLKADDDWIFPVFPSGYLSTFDRSVFISGSRGTYLGSTDEDGNFIALGNGGGRSAFGRINEDGTVIILYNPADQDP